MLLWQWEYFGVILLTHVIIIPSLRSVRYIQSADSIKFLEFKVVIFYGGSIYTVYM